MDRGNCKGVRRKRAGWARKEEKRAKQKPGIYVGVTSDVKQPVKSVMFGHSCTTDSTAPMRGSRNQPTQPEFCRQ